MLKGSKIGKSVQDFSTSIFKGFPVTPNQITVISVILAMVGFVFSVRRDFWTAFVFFGLSVFCDLADGAIARAKNLVSKKGGFLDGISDRMVEFFMLGSLMFYAWPAFILPSTFWLVLILFFGSAMTTYISAYAFLKGLADKEESPGALARPERVSLVLAIVFCLAMNFVVPAVILVVLTALLSMGTAATRFIHFWLKEEKA